MVMARPPKPALCSLSASVCGGLGARFTQLQAPRSSSSAVAAFGLLLWELRGLVFSLRRAVLFSSLLADRAYVLENGRIKPSATGAELAGTLTSCRGASQNFASNSSTVISRSPNFQGSVPPGVMMLKRNL